MVAGVTAQPTGATRVGGGVEMPQTLCVCLEWLQGLRHSLRGQQETGVGWRCLRLYVSVLNGCRGYGTAYGAARAGGGVEMPQTLCVCLEWLQGLRHSLRGQQEPGVGWRCLRLYVSVLNGCRG